MVSVASLKQDVIYGVAAEIAERRRDDRRLAKATEAQVQAAVCRHLATRAPKSAVWFHVPNGGSRHRIEAARLKGQGVMPGVPDLIILHDGLIYGLELKASRRGRLSPRQRDMHERLEAAGAIVATAYGIDEALEQLRLWGLLEK